MNASLLASTKAIFKSRYYIAKNDTIYFDHVGLLELQQLNAVDVGVGLYSRYSAVEVIDHESTSLGATSTLIVYLKCEVRKELPPSCLFLELIELPDQQSETVFEHLLTCLNKHGFHDDYLKENLVTFASDGASVMLGMNSGVSKKLVTKYANIVLWHCINHRLELALSDAVGEVSGVNNFQIFMDKLYILYNNSPKNQRQLVVCAAKLDQQVKKIGKGSVVTVIWHSFASLYNHFSTSKMTKIDARLSEQFTATIILSIFNGLTIMYNILAEIALLSESLQNRNMTVAYADKLIRRCIIFVLDWKKHQDINPQQLLTSVTNNLKRQLFTTISSNEPKSTSGSVHTISKQEEYDTLLTELKVTSGPRRNLPASEKLKLSVCADDSD
ncbi:hypothetical protein PR048_014809 [Dryococelus australis]|uniref:E3 SUMO-protein ligase KIAA1586-like n=1 Tax=Dryococelus australis TaxID=614101 RepID=A0ABQ9HFF7_9NEOP|nr:hypothetical protein PR048_014809 [Dryococelus australis]